MANCGIKKYDDLPSKVGLIDVDAWRYKKMEQKAWKQIIENTKSQILILKKEIDMLKRKAVKELRELGYSHDKICGILGIGKINSIKYSKKDVYNSSHA